LEIKHLHIEKELHKSPVAVLERYLEGELSAQEQQVVEAVLAEDPFMADALEGLRDMPDRTRVQTAGHELRFKTRKLLRVRKPRLSFFQTTQYATAAVAVILVLFVASIAVYMATRIENVAKEEVALAENRPAPAEAETADESLSPEPPPAPEETAETEPIAEAREVIAEEVPAAPAVSPSASSEPVDRPAASQEPARQVEATVPVTGDPSLSESQQQAYQQAFSPAEYQELLALQNTYDRHLARQAEQQARAREEARKMQKEAERMDDSYGEQEPAPAVGASPPPAAQTGSWKTVLALMKKGQHTEAERLLRAELKNDPTAALPWYQLGHFYLLNDQANKALPYLQAAARSPEPGTGYEARWQLSQAYLRLERNKEAEALLLDLSEQPGKHQGHARAQLQKLSGAGE
jgi:tetratricopeptide (TPR) repeat protein